MKNLLIFLPLILITALNSCNSPKYIVYEGYAQGTTFRMIYKSVDNYNDTIIGLLRNFDNSLSLYQDNSLICKINRNDSSVLLNDLFIEFYNKSREVFDQSEGYFDITVGPLVETWGFGAKETIRSDSASIDSIKKFVGMNKIWLEGNKIIKSDSRIKLDGNAIAQGQSVDYIANFFESKGLENYLVEIGGEIRVKGLNEKGQKWKIGIDKPIEDSSIGTRELQTVIELENKAMATSGNYRKFHLINGIKYSHSINPKTGYPSKDILLSATIVADECSIADGFATACMVMGFEKAKKLVLSVNGIDAYFIYSGKDGNLEEYSTLGFEKYISE